MSFHATGSQTVGPFFELGLSWAYAREIGHAAASGARFELRGRVYDGGGRPISDAVLEFWQADAHGKHGSDAEFTGFARMPVDASGGFSLRTIKPGRVACSDGTLQAPHISVYVFMRGLLLPIHTRVYFPDEPANVEDPVLAQVPESRRATLIASASDEGFFVWEVHTQGERETVCFSA
jgi:protocatechuate 3,4-dioxygenase alpha subunit